MWSNLQDESQSKYLLQPDVLRVERSFTGVVAPDVTKNEKSALKPEPMIQKAMSMIGKIRESLPVNSN